MIETPSMEEIPDFKIIAICEQKEAISVFESGVIFFLGIRAPFLRRILIRIFQDIMASIADILADGRRIVVGGKRGVH